MSNEKSNEIMGTILGAATTLGIGPFLFQLLGTFILGLVGALAGYLFTKFIKPKLDKVFARKKKPEA